MKTKKTKEQEANWNRLIQLCRDSWLAGYTREELMASNGILEVAKAFGLNPLVLSLVVRSMEIQLQLEMSRKGVK